MNEKKVLPIMIYHLIKLKIYGRSFSPKAWHYSSIFGALWASKLFDGRRWRPSKLRGDP